MERKDVVEARAAALIACFGSELTNSAEHLLKIKPMPKLPDCETSHTTLCFVWQEQNAKRARSISNRRASPRHDLRVAILSLQADSFRRESSPEPSQFRLERDRGFDFRPLSAF